MIITNAAGGINRDFKVGELMLISDFIKFNCVNPLAGRNIDEFGPRFPDMSRVLTGTTWNFSVQYVRILGKTCAKACISTAWVRITKHPPKYAQCVHSVRMQSE